MQIPLDIRLPEVATFDSFVAGDNGLLVRLLMQSAEKAGERQLYFWGEAGQGKSHLLQAVCRRAVEAGSTACYLPLAQLVSHAPSMLENLEATDVLCLDELDSLAGRSEWERGLFSLINRCRAGGTRLIFAAPCNIHDLGLALPDLASRLAWGPVFQLRSLSDGDKLEVLKGRARARGIELGDSVGRYMLHHYRRELRHLCQQLDTLDRASLAEQRRLTIPFIKSILDREPG